jgi:predicted nucleic acid-binding protein
VTLSEDLLRLQSLFFDTAPIIYYIEAHPQFGPLSKEAVQAVQNGNLTGYSSVITLSEVLAKPIQDGEEALARRFAAFLRAGKNFHLIDISADIAHRAGELRGKYPALRTVDSIQVASALSAGAEGFLTNDGKLKQITEIQVLILKDYL